MTTKQYNTMGLAVNFSVPADVAEFDLNAKKDGACLQSAIDNTVYRGSLAAFRDAFLHGMEADPAKNLPAIEGVEKITGVARKVKTVALKSKDAEGNAKTSEAWDETEVEYFQRALAESNRTKESFQDLANAVAARIEFDASERERGTGSTGPKRIGKAYLDAANKAQAEGKLETLAAKLTKKLGREVPATVEAVAIGIKEFSDAQAAALVA